MAETLAVCMMVRDEEENLPRCLESLARLEARLYVTDTGSRDRTREIALSFGAEIRDFPWADDFSAARNHAISDVSEDWILNLDADDFFPDGEAARIPGYLRDSSKAVLALDYEVEEDSTPARGLKLFRNRLGIRYKGIIHEYFRDSTKELPPDAVGEIPVLLKHSGYRPERMERKLQRNLPLLRREWQRCGEAGDRPQMLYVGKKLAENRLACGNRVEAENILLGLVETMLTRDERYASDWQVTLLTSLLHIHHDSGRDTEAEACCQRFESVFGEHPLFWLYRGISRLRLSLFEGALSDLERFEEYLQSNRLGLAVPKALLGPELWNYEGICRAALGRREAAAAAFKKAVAAEPENREYQARMRVALLSL